MPAIRTVVFWLHLAAGVLAGSVVLIMAITGVALTYEKQLLEWADRHAWSAPSSAPAERLSPEALLARVRAARPDAVPSALTLRADPTQPATVTLDATGPLLVDPTSGAIIGPPPAGLRGFFRVMTRWHRWLAMEGDSRSFGKSVTGAANLVFLFIILSGIYLWVPRVWTRLQLRNVLWFRTGLTSRARDFNWHHVIGIWSAVPLAIIVAGAVPISYPWASALVYRVAGEAPPPRGPAATASEERPATARTVDLSGIDAAFGEAVRRVPAWRSMTLRLSQGAPTFTLAVDEGYGGQPQKRGTLTFDRTAATPLRWETFDQQGPGRRLRSWLRFAHTGEFYGLAGQTVAGLATAGGAVLVWTGLSLAWRRLRTWQLRRHGAASDGAARRAA